MTLTLGSLFAGIGGLERGLELAGLDDGLPAGLARLPGNAVAPYVAEVIGRALLAAEAA